MRHNLGPMVLEILVKMSDDWRCEVEIKDSPKKFATFKYEQETIPCRKYFHDDINDKGEGR